MIAAILFICFSAGISRTVELPECKKPERRVVTEDERRALPHAKPPLLLTFPGSGNTWFRMLIEMGTGFLTSSIYNDTALKDVLRGEFQCDNSVIVIKGHSHVKEIDEEIFSNLFMKTAEELPLKTNCRMQRPFKAFIGVIRDPFHAALAEATRRITKNHFTGITPEELDAVSPTELEEMLLNLASIWVQYMRDYNHLIELGFEFGQDFLLIKFEDMLSPLFRYESLSRLIQFVLGPNINSPHGPLTKQTMDCIFQFSEDQRVHRTHAASVVSADEILRPALVCKIWKIVHHYAGNFGYRPPFGILCSGT